MTEYFVMANSNAAPMFSDTSSYYIKADSPEEARDKAVKEYKHSCGLYALNVYGSADDYHKNKDPLAKWRSKKAKEAWDQ